MCARRPTPSLWWLVALACTCHPAFAQTSTQGRPPVPLPLVPDARRPGRDIQPTMTPEPDKAPRLTEDNAGEESLFSNSTRFAVEMQPANHPDLPGEAALLQIPVTLYQVGGRLSGSASSNGVAITRPLGELSSDGSALTDSARVAIQNAVVAGINARGVAGVACLVEAAPDATKPNIIKVVAVQVGGVRTIATGVRSGETGQAVNSDKHATVRNESPLKEGDVMRNEVLEDYLYSLSRFPGRNVSAAMSNEPTSEQVILDYFISERTIFDIYAGVSNTGTTETSKYQYRAGFLATQLTNNDDILSFDYQNSNFANTQSLNGYYDARVGTMNDLRWRISGQWGQYYSSDVGQATQDFSGDNWGTQGDLIWTFLQHGNSFLDFDAGLKGWGSTAQNNLFDTSGNATFITASGSLNTMALGETWASQGNFGFAYTSTDADQVSLDDLGRTDTSKGWVTFNGSIYGSVYLDPLLDPSWGKGNSLYKPLVNELYGSVRGQYAFDYRLTPLAQYTMGGLFTVRGFPQSITAGDNAVVGTLEYRMHLPRMFSPTEPTGHLPWSDKPFRLSPDSANGAAPDWDLVLSTFFDAGYVSDNQAYAFEATTPMYSTGVGLDLTIMNNVSVGVDWGWALNSVDQLGVDAGSSQFWFTANIVY